MLAAGKVTIGLASHWPRVTDISGSPPTGSRPRRGRWAPTYARLWSMVDITFTFIKLYKPSVSGRLSVCGRSLVVSAMTAMSAVPRSVSPPPTARSASPPSIMSTLRSVSLLSIRRDRLDRSEPCGAAIDDPRPSSGERSDSRLSEVTIAGSEYKIYLLIYWI